MFPSRNKELSIFTTVRLLYHLFWFQSLPLLSVCYVLLCRIRIWTAIPKFLATDHALLRFFSQLFITWLQPATPWSTTHFSLPPTSQELLKRDWKHPIRKCQRSFLCAQGTGIKWHTRQQNVTSHVPVTSIPLPGNLLSFYTSICSL